MKLTPWIVASGLGAALCYTACAFPDFRYLEPEDDDDTTTTTTAGGGGSGGMAGQGGFSTGGGGSGGGWPCDPYQVGVCGHDMKCTVVNENLGIPDGLGCAEAGQRPSWTRCSSNEECSDGDWCDYETEVCRPICKNGNSCPTGATCHAMNRLGGAAIPGLRACTSHCHPETGAPCDDSQGVTTCYYNTNLLEFDCATTAGVLDGNTCSPPTDCAKGLACIDASGWECMPWCTPPDLGSGQCPGFMRLCAKIDDVAVLYSGIEYGVCI